MPVQIKMDKIPQVNQETCIGCGTCVALCPKVFELDENGKSEVKDPAGCKECNCQEAIDACPVNAISWEENNK